MNWDAIGAIGELAGAIGVIITLVYLSLQIRSSTKATESQIHVSLSSEMERLAIAMSTNDSLTDAMHLAQTGGELTQQQRIKLEWWFGGFLRVCESHVIQRHLQATNIDLEEPIGNLLRRFGQSEVFLEQMREAVQRKTASREFLSWLDSEVLSKEVD